GRWSVGQPGPPAACLLRISVAQLNSRQRIARERNQWGYQSFRRKERKLEPFGFLEFSFPAPGRKCRSVDPFLEEPTGRISVDEIEHQRGGEQSGGDSPREPRRVE